MFSIKTAVVSTTLFLAIQSGALAAEKCYEDVPVPASVNCNGSTSKSADFASGCKYTPATVEKKEIECPVSLSWVNADGKTSQSATCAAAGLKPGSLDGQVCAAGERRPSEGLGASSINYRFGKWGSGGGKGGTTAQFYSRTTTTGNRDDRVTKTISNYYCWSSGNKRDYDSTDIAVAYVCER
ncbi:hypothetical protein O9X98_05160 [Agrobacterium salinitolerans]|nr:hypothetical protein [Agrobacterium salinitolerans]